MKMKWFNLAIISLFLSGCEAPFSTNLPPEADHVEISIITGNNINNKLGLNIDIVQIYDKKIFEMLKSMDATMFQAKKNQLIFENPDTFTIWSLDFTAHQSKSYTLPSGKNYWGVIIYLHFIDNPQNKIVLSNDMKKVRLNIQDENFIISKDHGINITTHLYVGENNIGEKN